jgi:hypothetical protein
LSYFLSHAPNAMVRFRAFNLFCSCSFPTAAATSTRFKWFQSLRKVLKACTDISKTTGRARGQFISDIDNREDDQDAVTLFGVDCHKWCVGPKFYDSPPIISATPPFQSQLHQSENPRILQSLRDTLKNPLDSNGWLRVYVCSGSS